MKYCVISQKNFLSYAIIIYLNISVYITSTWGNRVFGNGQRGQIFRRPIHSGFQQGGWNGHGGGGNHWLSESSNQPQNEASCRRPQFSDNAEIVIENCSKNRFLAVCRSSDTDIPSNWKVTMLCQKGSITLRYSSACSSTGNWEPSFYENCQQLYQQSVKDFGQGLSVEGTSLAVTEEPVLKSCLPLQVQSSKNFIYSCKFPGQAEESEGCKVDGKVVLSGTIASLKCRPPFTSQNGLFSEWTCENGHWVGESKKVLCFYSSGNQWNVQPNNGQRPPISEGTETDIEPSKPLEILPKPVPTLKPSIGRTTQQPSTTKPVVIQTTIQPTTKKPIVAPVTEKPAKSTTTTTTVQPGSKPMCPALKHRSPGVKVDCVYGSGSGGVSENNCNTPQPAGTEAKYSCLPYYEAAGGLATLFRKCREDGRWTGSSETFSCNIECGRANQVKVAFITNGLPTVRGQWPWHTAMFLHEQKQKTWSYICGGTLIGTKAILTAAHCVTLVQTTHLRPVNTLRLDFGKYKREDNDDLVQSSDVHSIHIHPSYNPYGYDSDIAVVTLKSEIKIGYHVRPICFPQTSDSALEELQLSENSVGTTVGFGYNEKNELADELQMARLRVIGPRECSETIKSDVSGQIQTRSTTYCAGFKNGTNVCNGDSGSGMYFPSKNADQTKWYLQGLVSVGIADDDGHCDPNQLSVFTRVGRYADWIVRTLSEN